MHVTMRSYWIQTFVIGSRSSYWLKTSILVTDQCKTGSCKWKFATIWIIQKLSDLTVDREAIQMQNSDFFFFFFKVAEFKVAESFVTTSYQQPISVEKHWRHINKTPDAQLWLIQVTEAAKVDCKYCVSCTSLSAVLGDLWPSLVIRCQVRWNLALLIRILKYRTPTSQPDPHTQP